MKVFTKWRFLFSAVIIVLLFCFSFPSFIGPEYYSHIIYGELQILAHRTPIDTLLADQKTSQELKNDLREISKMREFAVSDLKLPDTDSFTSYVDIGREYVTWVLTATPEFSVVPKRWCFPAVGCSSFLGFFDEKMAERAKEKLVRQGYDVSLRGVNAYSTIGWFSDPVMNTYFNRSYPALANLVFHEKAHEKIFIRGDTPFNEAFATFIGETGERLWIVQRYGEKKSEKMLLHEKYSKDFSLLMTRTNRELRALYRQKITPGKMRILKKEIFADMQSQYSLLKKTWGGYAGYDDWFAKDFNNADIVNQNAYKSLVPFFQKLFELSGKNFGVFYESVEKIAMLPRTERYLEIQKILSK